MRNVIGFKWLAVSLCSIALLAIGFPQKLAAQQNWNAAVGAQSHDMGHQASAYLPNEMWIHAGDSITWSFNSDEIHTVSFLVVGQPFPPFPVGCPGFSFGAANFDGSTCVTTPPLIEGQGNFTVTFPAAGNFRLQCLVHNTMNGTIHVLDASAALPYDQAAYDEQAAVQARGLLNDRDHESSSDSATTGHGSAHAMNAVSVRVLAAHQQFSGTRKKLSASSGPEHSATAHVTAGVGEIVATPGGVQTASVLRFLKGKIVIHAGETVEWSNSDPEEPHTVTIGTEPADTFDPSPNVTKDEDGGLHATISSLKDSAHSGFLVQPLPDQPGLPVNSNPDNAIALNPTRFRVTFLAPGTYKYICALHDELGMVGEVVVTR